MILEFVLGFVIVVAASYIGSTMALRGYFGREWNGERFDDHRGTTPESNDDPERG